MTDPKTNTTEKHRESHASHVAAPEHMTAPLAIEGVREGLESVMPSESLAGQKERSAQGSAQAAASQQSGSATATRPFTVPETKEQLIRVIDHELHKQLATLSREAQRAGGTWFRPMDPIALSEILAQIRKIQVMLSELVYMTIEALKTLYRSLFQPKGL